MKKYWRSQLDSHKRLQCLIFLTGHPSKKWQLSFYDNLINKQSPQFPLHDVIISKLSPQFPFHDVTTTDSTLWCHSVKHHHSFHFMMSFSVNHHRSFHFMMPYSVNNHISHHVTRKPASICTACNDFVQPAIQAIWQSLSCSSRNGGSKTLTIRLTYLYKIMFHGSRNGIYLTL